ncbi:MAG: hypothetical protein LJE68_07465 [Rhodobacter sp.]|jgi:hypothetical protein|nr:hypothetical protein [Rhodobacter sp.]
MIVFNAGVPRSGTVLVGAILRALYAEARVATALDNAQGPELPRHLGTLIETGRARREVRLIHTHSWDPETERLAAGSP